MHQRLQCRNQVRAVAAHLDAQCALAGSGQHAARFEFTADALGHVQALEAGGRQHDGVVLAFVQLAQTGVEVAAQRLDLQVRAQGLQQHLAAQAGGADDGTLGQCIQAGVAGGDKGVARVFPFHHAGQCKAFGQFHGHILEGVHGDVGAAFFQGHFQFLDEQALAADLGQRTVQNLVALGGHAQQFHLVATCAQQGLHMFGLPQGQAAFTGGDHKRGRSVGSSHGLSAFGATGNASMRADTIRHLEPFA